MISKVLVTFFVDGISAPYFILENGAVCGANYDTFIDTKEYSANIQSGYEPSYNKIELIKDSVIVKTFWI